MTEKKAMNNVAKNTEKRDLVKRCDMTELTVTEYDWNVGQMFVYSLAGLHQTIDKLAQSLK